MRKWMTRFLILIVALLAIIYLSADRDMRRLFANLPTDTEVLFWSIAQRDGRRRVPSRVRA